MTDAYDQVTWPADQGARGGTHRWNTGETMGHRKRDIEANDAKYSRSWVQGDDDDHNFS